MPGAQAEAPNLRVTTTEVLVPTLVEKRGGGILYGLKPTDFVLEDNGVPQKIRVQEEMDTAPVALVVAVELGGVSVLEFDKLAKMGPLLDVFLSDPRSQVALVGFDSVPHLIQDYTHSGDQVNAELQQLQPGDGGAAILDTVNYGVTLLETQPKEFRRVLLLISEERDHGSKHTKPVELIRKIGESDVLVLSVSFSPALAELGHDVKDSGEDRTMNMVSALVMAGEGIQEECGQRSGGDERRRVHNVCGRQALRGACAGCGEGRAQPLSDYLQPVGSDAGVAYDSRADGAGLRSADCGEGELLAGCAAGQWSVIRDQAGQRRHECGRCVER